MLSAKKTFVLCKQKWFMEKEEDIIRLECIYLAYTAGKLPLTNQNSLSGHL